MLLKEKRQRRKGGLMPQSTEAGRQCGTDQRKEEKEVELTDQQVGQNQPLLGHLQSMPEFFRPCVKTEKIPRDIEMDDTEAGCSEGSTAERTCQEARRKECNQRMCQPRAQRKENTTTYWHHYFQ